MAAASPRGKQPNVMVPSGQPAAVLYLRVSTREQARKGGEVEGYSIPAQRDFCIKKAQELGAVVGAEFVDPGSTGRTDNRPGLQTLLAHLREVPTSYVIVHKLDRLARDMKVHVLTWAAIEAVGAELVSCSEQIDNTPQGKF